MKFITPIFLACSLFFILACNSDTTQKEANTTSNTAIESKPTDTKTTTPVVEEKPEKPVASNQTQKEPEHKTAIHKDAVTKQSSKKKEKSVNKTTNSKKANKPPVVNTAPPTPSPEAVKVESPTSPPPPPPPPVTVEKPVIEKPTAPKPEKPSSPTPPTPVVFSHSAWDVLLRKHVSASGKVNYKAFKADKTALDAYTKYLSDNPIKTSWSRNKKMAYWINAYNAFTIKLIVDNYPIESITKLDGGKPWDKKWIKLGDKTYSLNNIENDILRPQYKDARIHFAVNCAAKSCPPILNRAWTSKNLESNLEKQAKAFINDATHNRISNKEIEISKIFEWYAVDFSSIIDYLNIYSNTTIDKKAKIKYMEYNWSLNQ